MYTGSCIFCVHVGGSRELKVLLQTLAAGGGPAGQKVLEERGLCFCRKIRKFRTPRRHI
jgi:hypothetical protein